MATIKLICDECGKSFEKERSEHNRRIKKGCTNFFCNSQCAGKGLERPNKIHVPITAQCLWCKSLIETTTRSKAKKCCSRTCSAKYSRSTCKDIHKSEEFRLKASKHSKALWSRPDYIDKCMINSGKRRFNSKGEIELREYLRTTLPEYKFTTGMLAGAGSNPDIWSKEYKVVIEYDGAWHFKDIKGQLADKQEKDKRLEDWCIENKWRCIRIKEEVYKKDVSYWQEKIKNEILGGVASIVKMY
jgi:very-short-patch-repair endonuclease